MSVNKMDAIILSQSMIYASPSYDKTGVAKKRRSWKKFMDSLDWNKVQSTKKKPSMEALKSLFGSMGVQPKKKDVK